MSRPRLLKDPAEIAASDRIKALLAEIPHSQAANETPMNEIASVGVRQQATDDFVARVRARLGACIQAQPD